MHLRLPRLGAPKRDLQALAAFGTRRGGGSWLLDPQFGVRRRLRLDLHNPSGPRGCQGGAPALCRGESRRSFMSIHGARCMYAQLTAIVVSGVSIVGALWAPYMRIQISAQAALASELN